MKKLNYTEYRKLWQRVSNRELVTDFPMYLQIEHVGKCNLRCAGCINGHKELRDEYSRGLKPLDIKTYKKILKEAKKYHCPSIAFHNNDEPLLLPDMEERIKMAKKAGFIDLIMTTNATLLTKERADKLLKSGLTKINFSVDARDDKTYKKIRGADFRKTLGQILYLVLKRNNSKSGLPFTRATCVINKHTISKKKSFEKFWGMIVDRVDFQNFQSIKGYTEYLRPRKSKVDKSFVCVGPWQQLTIRPNGDVLPCCSFYGHKLVVGNIHKDTLFNIWHSPQMEKIRDELLIGNYKFCSVCKDCSERIWIK